jgi:hypothetical protein
MTVLGPPTVLLPPLPFNPWSGSCNSCRRRTRSWRKPWTCLTTTSLYSPIMAPSTSLMADLPDLSLSAICFQLGTRSQPGGAQCLRIGGDEHIFVYCNHKAVTYHS